jgi:hypothetical protein
VEAGDGEVGERHVPIVLRIDGYRFSFYSNEGSEPPHIHVRRGDGLAKWWLDPIAEVHSERFTVQERRAIRGYIERFQSQMIEAWNEYFAR